MEEGLLVLEPALLLRSVAYISLFLRFIAYECQKSSLLKETRAQFDDWQSELDVKGLEIQTRDIPIPEADKFVARCDRALITVCKSSGLLPRSLSISNPSR